MIHGLKNRLLLIPALLLTAQVLLGQAPTGQLSIPFTKDTVPVWDVAGAYGLSQTAIGSAGLEVPVAFGLDLAQDNRGGLKGSDVTVLQINDQYVAATYKASGRVYRSGDDTRVVFSVNFSGKDYMAGAVRKFAVALKYSLVVDPDTLQMVGTVRGNVSVGGSGSSRVNMPISIPVPSGVQGSWTLNLDLVTLNRIAGTAVISVSQYLSPDTVAGESTTRDLDGDVSGSYSSKTDQYTIRVSGTGTTGRGTSLQVVLAPVEGASDFSVVSVRGQVLGQSLRWTP